MPVPARPPHRLLPAPRHIRPAVGAFLLLALVSALLYSGGHNLDPQALWFHPVHNFLCDLFMPLNTYNGRPNMASALPGISGGLLLVAGLLLLSLKYHPAADLATDDRSDPADRPAHAASERTRLAPGTYFFRRVRPCL